MIDYDAVSFLKNLFSGTATATAPDVSADGPHSALAGDGADAIDAGGGEADGAAAFLEAADVLLEQVEADEDVALPPCPTCGSWDLWETIPGNWRCQHCDAAALARSRSLADKAARLRAESLWQRQFAEISIPPKLRQGT